MVLQVTSGLRELDEAEENVLPYGAKTTTINLQKIKRKPIQSSLDNETR